ncbi:MAG: ATP-binding cassette domain-containing protein [Planctomycetota bacterium]|nr:MAG: ATP-binding cassette domain-containing protein [Planctomycetota bacterium]
MLELERVCKAFYDPGRGAVHAVDDISLHAEDQVVVLVGPNGAGKTTLLRLISGILKPDSGRIEVAGYDAALQADAVRARLGYLSPATRLYPRLTGREMLAYAAGFYDMADAAFAAALDDMVDAFALAEFLDQPCATLSTGQAQRINLARTLICDPPVLVLDEPTTGMDLTAAAAVVRAVQRFRRPGRLILFCTHDTSEVEAVGGRLLVLCRGRMVHDGPVDALGSGNTLRDHIFDLLERNGQELPQ